MLLHSVSLADFLLDKGSGGRARVPWLVPLPMLGSDGNVYIVKEGESPRLAVISLEGTVLSSVALAIPRGRTLDYSRLLGNRLIARTVSTKADPNGKALRQSLTEFDTGTGEMISDYSMTPADNWWPGCDLGTGLSAIDPTKRTLDVLEPIQ